MKINKVGEVDENKGQKFVDFLTGYIRDLNVLESDTVLIFQLVDYYLHTFSKIKDKEENGYKYGGFILNKGNVPFDAFDKYEYYSEQDFQLILDFAHKNKINV